MSVDFSNIKVAVFDFDDTLAIHENRDYAVARTNDYFVQARLYPYLFYTKLEPCYTLKEMEKLVQACREQNIVMYCLSGMRCSLHAKAKEYFIEKHYGTDIELVSAKSQEMKLEVLDMFTQIHKCTASEILYIDDYETNIVNATALGYTAFNVGQISELVNKL